MEEKDEVLQRILTENLRLGRAFIFLKREILLLRTEREERKRNYDLLKNDNITFETKLQKLQVSYEHIKEVQNHLSYEYSIIEEKFNKLEEIILSYGKSKDK
jgi:chromosome segregation ATPase